MLQKTISKSIGCSGVGLHSGKIVKLTLHPAAENTGIIFHIHGEDGVKVVSPTPQLVTATQLATVLMVDEASAATVEHLLAAISGMQIDNIRIEIQGGEVPIMDGSAGSFIFLLKDAGLREQSKARTVQRIKKEITFERDGKRINAKPHNGLRIDYTIDFDHPLIGVQTKSVEITPETFASEIAKARTFGFFREVEYMRSKKLALGGSLENAIVLDDYGILNEDGLRYPDEFVRHKILDFIGDMIMLGTPLEGHFDVHCSGHALNNQFLRAIDENADIYLESVTLDEPAPAAVGHDVPAVAASAAPAVA